MRKLVVVLIVFLLSLGSVILHNALKKGDSADKKRDPDNVIIKRKPSNAEKITLQKDSTISRTFTPLDSILDSKYPVSVKKNSLNDCFLASKSRQEHLTGFTGRGKGFVGGIEVMVFFESENASMEVVKKEIPAMLVMTKIEIIKSEEIRAKWLPAKKKIIEKVLSSQSLDVDVVTGATASSKGLLEAIKDARKKAYRSY